MNIDELRALVERRRSTRGYDESREVSDEIIRTILDCARWAPSGGNGQPWEFIVVRDQATRYRIADYYMKQMEQKREMDLAVQISPEDAGIRYQYGYALGTLNKLKEAEAQLTKAIELDPDFAAPHFVLADVYQAETRKADALREFKSFLALASQRDPRREEATELAGILSASQ